jgi:hypothetical protein
MASYPSRLEVELKASFPKQAITVLNRGVNGEESGRNDVALRLIYR